MKKIDLAFIVDDDEIYVYGLKRLVAIHDLCKNLLVFNNGEEAIKYLKPIMANADQLPDIILLDINMPIMDGWDFLNEFIKIEANLSKKITIYMITSSINNEDIEKAKTYSEVSNYFVKPVTLDTLKQMFTITT